MTRLSSAAAKRSGSDKEALEQALEQAQEQAREATAAAAAATKKLQSELEGHVGEKTNALEQVRHRRLPLPKAQHSPPFEDCSMISQMTRNFREPSSASYPIAFSLKTNPTHCCVSGPRQGDR